MAMFYLERTDYSGNIACPYCGQDYDVVWYTEYSEPQHGSHDMVCLDCNLEFEMNVTVVTHYGTLPKLLKRI